MTEEAETDQETIKRLQYELHAARQNAINNAAEYERQRAQTRGWNQLKTNLRNQLCKQYAMQDAYEACLQLIINMTKLDKPPEELLEHIAGTAREILDWRPEDDEDE